MAIKKPTESSAKKNHIIMINGSPGIGKSTLALSAPNVLFIDTDSNINKVNIAHRTADIIDTLSYTEMFTDLKTADLSMYDTIVFDTGGALVNMIKQELITDPKNRRKDGALTLQGYGVLKNKFEELFDYCIFHIKKNIVIINHIVERTEDEKTVYRIDVEGSSGRHMWKKAELGAFMYIDHGKTILDFSPGDRHFAKSAYGITGKVEVPRLQPGDPNVFLSNMFEHIDNSIREDEKLMTVYFELMSSIRELLGSATDGASLDEILSQYAGFQWMFTAKKEAGVLLSRRAKELGYKYNHESKKFEGDPKCVDI